MTFFLTSCSSTPQSGLWQMALPASGGSFIEAFFHIEQTGKSGEYTVRYDYHNESWSSTHHVNDLPWKIPLGIYQNFIEIRSLSKDSLSGAWVRKDRDPTLRIPLKMTYLESEKKLNIRESSFLTESPLRIVFENNAIPASLGSFQINEKGKIQGSIVTPTGDLGLFVGKQGKKIAILNVFNGVFAYRLEIEKEGDRITGVLITTEKRLRLRAFIDADFQVEFPTTKVKNPEKKIHLTLPSIDGEIIDTQSARYLNKPLILQIYGSWCPNCYDETVFLADWYAQQDNQDKVEVIALAFEKMPSLVQAQKQVDKTLRKLNVPYQFVIASHDSQVSPGELLALENFQAYPTTLFLNKNHQVVGILSGFAASHSGTEYDRHVKRFYQMLKQQKSSRR